MAALRRANPMMQIPTLQLPDGSVLGESAAILIHLGLAFPSSGLLPSAEAGRARALHGMVFIATNCYAAIGVVDFPERWSETQDETTLASIRAGARARLHHCWEVFADSFGAEPFLTGTQPGALDMLAAVVSRWSGARAYLRAQRPAFHAILERIQAHPGLAPVFARHWPDSIAT
jgi:GST-like protein